MNFVDAIAFPANQAVATLPRIRARYAPSCLSLVFGRFAQFQIASRSRPATLNR